MTLSYTIVTSTLLIIKRVIHSLMLQVHSSKNHSPGFYILTSDVVYFISDVIKQVLQQPFPVEL